MTPLPHNLYRAHLLTGCFEDVRDAGLLDAMDEWIELANNDVLKDDPEWAAYEFIRLQQENTKMPKKKKTTTTNRRKPGRKPGADVFILPTERSVPVDNPWRYAYLLTGVPKIGKTSLAIEGCEEFVLQFDKPQLAYSMREEVITSWAHFLRVLKALELAATDGGFPYDRIIVDGAGEWYTMCHAAVCKHFGIEHPSDEGYARAWHKLRDDFNAAVNRLLRLQNSADCGLMFIAHSEWKEKKLRGQSDKIEQLVPALPGRSGDVLTGKCDAWFCMEHIGSRRAIIIQGDDTVQAGHRIDGHFVTPDGRRVEEIPMGNSSQEALENFLAAFDNKQSYVNIRELRTKEGGKRRAGGKKKVGKKTKKTTRKRR